MTGLLSSFSVLSPFLSSFQSTPRCQGTFAVLEKKIATSFKALAATGDHRVEDHCCPVVTLAERLPAGSPDRTHLSQSRAAKRNPGSGTLPVIRFPNAGEIS